MTSVVIGGGIYGCMMAFRLAQDGDDVLLLEAGEVAGGASGGLGTRGLRANYRGVAELPLASRALRLWSGYRRRLGLDMAVTGSLLVTEKEVHGASAGMVSLADRAWVQGNHGVETHVLGPDETRALEPHLTTAVLGGLYAPHDGDIDHTAATRAFAAAASRAGATIRSRTPVTRIAVDPGGSARVELDGDHPVTVDGAVFLLANAGVRELAARSFGLHLPLWCVHPQLIHIRPPTGGVLRHPLGHDHHALVIRPLRDGTLLYSGRWRGRHDPATGAGVTVPAEVEGNLAVGARTIPALAGAEVLATDASRADSGTPDGLPIVDTVAGCPRVFYATGWGGHGYGIAPAVVEALHEWWTTGTRPAVLAPFRHARFAPSHQRDERDL